MCELAKYEALTNRHAQHRRAKREVAAPSKIAEMVSVAPAVGAVEARKMLHPAFVALQPADQELLHALFAEGKTIHDLAKERGLRWTTMKSRVQRLLDLLYATIRASMVALVLLLPKRARGFVAHIARRAPRMLMHTSQFSGAITVTMVCGVLLPTGSSAMAEPLTPVGLTPYSTPRTNMAQAADLQPSFIPEVEPEEPKPVDAETNPCSPVNMKSTKFATFLQETVVPFAFLVAPAVTQVACTGTGQQTPPARQPVEDPDDDPEYEAREREDRYHMWCNIQRWWGEKCPTREEYDKLMGHK